MLTVPDVREHVTTDLSDAAIQRLLDAAYADIEREIGPAGERTVVLEAVGRYVVLPLDELTITAVVEDADGLRTSLAADDWRRRGVVLERLSTGTNPRTSWLGRVEVTLAPDDEALRDRTALALVQLGVEAHPGLASQQIGEWRETYLSADQEAIRRELLAALHAPLGVL